MAAKVPMGITVRTDDVGPIRAESRTVTPGYFATLKIPFVAGEDFADRPSDHPKVVISRGLARRLCGRDWVVGGRVKLYEQKYLTEVAGVVADVRSLGAEVGAPFEAYEPHRNSVWPVMSLAIRTDMQA